MKTNRRNEILQALAVQDRGLGKRTALAVYGMAAIWGFGFFIPPVLKLDPFSRDDLCRAALATFKDITPTEVRVRRRTYLQVMIEFNDPATGEQLNYTCRPGWFRASVLRPWGRGGGAYVRHFASGEHLSITITRPSDHPVGNRTYTLKAF